jgi:type IV pilus assembly protein PilM
MFSALSSMFPPPTYLTMPCVGVDISENSLKYISFHPKKVGQERKLKEWGEIKIPNGVVKRGEVMDPEQLASVLREFKQITNANLVRISLPEERAYLFETEIKGDVPHKEMRGLLEFRLEENVPISPSEVLFDFSILPQKENSRHIPVAVAAYAKKTIHSYYEVCTEAELFPVSFEIEAQSMIRSMVPVNQTGAVLMIDLGKNRTGIGISYQDVLLYTSTIDLGGDHLSKVLRRQLGEDIAESELTNIKNTQGLARSVTSPGVSEALLQGLSAIKDEVKTRMQYWHLRNNDDPLRQIGAVYLCGGSANLRGLPEYFTESLGVTCVRGNVWERVFSLKNHVPPIDRWHSFGYATAIGLALRDNL